MVSDTNKISAKPCTVLLAIIIGGVVYGLLRTLFNTFFDFVHANHEYAADAALLFFIVIYIVIKAGSIGHGKKTMAALYNKN